MPPYFTKKTMKKGLSITANLIMEKRKNSGLPQRQCSSFFQLTRSCPKSFIKESWRKIIFSSYSHFNCSVSFQKEVNWVFCHSVSALICSYASKPKLFNAFNPLCWVSIGALNTVVKSFTVLESVAEYWCCVFILMGRGVCCTCTLSNELQMLVWLHLYLFCCFLANDVGLL